jgi:hypothetical protein
MLAAAPAGNEKVSITLNNYERRRLYTLGFGPQSRSRCPDLFLPCDTVILSRRPVSGKPVGFQPFINPC